MWKYGQIFDIICFVFYGLRKGVLELKRLAAVFMISVLVISLFSGCSLPNKELALSFPMPDAPKSLDPQIASQKSERLFVRNCFEGLVTVDSDGNIIPGAAESYTVSDDSLVYTFKIREDARWYLTNTAREGLAQILPADFDTRVTAHDFVFAFRRAVQPQTACPDSELFLSIKNADKIFKGELDSSELGVEALSDYELRIILSHPERNFLINLTNPAFAPCNEVFFNACGGRYGLALKYIICNGPFILFRWNTGGSLRLDRNSVYKGERSAVPDIIRLYINADTASIAEKVHDGDYGAGIISSADAASLMSDKKLSLTERTDILWAFVFNSGREPFSFKDMRQAFVAATNISELSVPEHFKGHALSPAPESLTQGIKNPSLIAFDEEAARSRFKKAQSGAELTGLSVLCLKEHEEILKPQLQQWQKIFGINFSVSLLPLELSELKTRVEAGNYDVALYPVQTDSADIVSYLRGFSIERQDGIYCTEPSYRQAVEALATGRDGGFEEKAAELLQTLVDEAVLSPVFSQSRFLAINKSVRGIYFYPSIDDLYFISATNKKTKE